MTTPMLSLDVKPVAVPLKYADIDRIRHSYHCYSVPIAAIAELSKIDCDTVKEVLWPTSPYGVVSALEPIG